MAWFTGKTKNKPGMQTNANIMIRSIVKSEIHQNADFLF